MKTVGTLLAALQLLTLLTACLCRSGDTWTQLQVQCVAEAAAFHTTSAHTEQHCTMLASAAFPSGILVAQFKPASSQCGLFRYQSVCRGLLSGLSSDCRVLIRFPIKYPAHSLNSKLTNVWLGDDMTRFENVVCQADEVTNRVYPIGVKWTEEGAEFDGSSSYLALNKSDITFATGVTVLLRMKRKPQIQPFLDFVDCQESVVRDQFWENNAASKLFVIIKTQAAMVPAVYTTTNPTLPTNASEWLNIGFTSTVTADSWGLFVKDSFIPTSAVSISTNGGNYALLSQNCFSFGKRQAYFFNGVVKAIAIGSSFMSESEIREFFAQFN